MTLPQNRVKLVVPDVAAVPRVPQLEVEPGNWAVTFSFTPESTAAIRQL